LAILDVPGDSQRNSSEEGFSVFTFPVVALNVQELFAPPPIE
jgi:hypothetical protein